MVQRGNAYPLAAKPWNQNPLPDGLEFSHLHHGVLSYSFNQTPSI